MTAPVSDSERRDLNGFCRAHALERGRGWFGRVEIVSILA